MNGAAPPYNDLDNAAAAALFMLARQQDVQRYEHIGLLYQDGEKIGRTPTASRHEQEHVKGTFRIPSGSLRALFHNHPTPRGWLPSMTRQFSDEDKIQAQQVGVPSYIGTSEHEVRRYDPTTGETTDVLAEFPIDEFRSYLMQKLLDRAPNDPRGLMR